MTASSNMENASTEASSPVIVPEHLRSDVRLRSSAAKSKNARARTRRPAGARTIFRRCLPAKQKSDSAPLLVADFVFRKQVEWITENTGVREDFKDVAQKIWFSYLSLYMPSLKKGVEKLWGGDDQWHLAFPRGDQRVLLNCSRQELNGHLEKLRLQPTQKITHYANMGMRPVPFDESRGRVQRATVAKNFKYCRPTACTLFAVFGLALHLCQEEVLISDLLRWTRLLKLPLLDMSAYKGNASAAELRGLSNLSQTLHGVNKYSEVESKVLWLGSNLLRGNTDRLPSLPVAPFVERFIEELNLPSAMVPFVLNILENINALDFRFEYAAQQRTTAGSYKRGKNLESRLMSCIFYALRLLFVLDDNTENLISQATTQIQDLVPCVKFFNFETWYHHLMHRRVLLSKHTMLSRDIHGCRAYLDFIEGHQMPQPPAQKISSAGFYESRHLRQCRQELQRSFLLDNAENLRAAELFVDLPVTVRPYRAHTVALAAHHPELSVDFGQHSIGHLLDEQTSVEALGSEYPLIRSQLLDIQQARHMAYNQTMPYRFYQYHATSRKKRVDEDNLSRITRDLIRTMADMIDQDASFLVGNLVNLELIFYPKHPLCKKGRHSHGIKMLRNAQHQFSSLQAPAMS